MPGPAPLPGAAARFARALFPARFARRAASDRGGPVRSRALAGFAPAALVLVCGLLCACASTQPPAPAVMALSLSGPPLAVAGEYAGMELEGSMDRAVMTGKGEMRLAAVSAGDFLCTASVDSMPTQKARVRGFLICNGERRLPFSLRNTGPDQGVGIARESEDSGLMVLFYHPSMEEAKRRLPEVVTDLDKARSLGR